MATESPTPETSAPDKALSPAVRPSAEYDAEDVVALYLNGAVFDQLQRVAMMMSKAGLVPAHLRGPDHIADCFLIVAQAFRWRIDPFAVAQHTFVVSGKLGYEGKLVAALINTHRKVARALDYEYSGAGKERKVRVAARLHGEEKDREIDGTVEHWATDNPKWKSMPDQMLAYRGAREWARRHLPEALLGIDNVEEPGPAVTLVPGKDGAFVAPAAEPDPLLAGAAPAAPVEHASHSDKEISLHPADAPGAEKEPPVVVHPPVTPPATPEPTGTGPFGKAVAALRGRGTQKTLSED
jgi:hypothetical protein